MFVWFGVAIVGRLVNHFVSDSGLAVVVLANALTFVVMSMTTLGMFRNALLAVGGQPPHPRNLFMVSGLIWYIFVSVVSTFVVVVGLALLVMPGVIIGGFWLLFPYLIAERQTPWLSSLSQSWRLVRGSWGYVVGTWLATYVVMAISGLLTFGLAFFVTVPWTLLVHARVYRWLTT
jgi:hypothetical protein